MKKSNIFSILTACILIVMGSCIHNGGAAGGLFGKWHLVRIDGINIAPPDIDNTEIYFSFQKDVMMLQRDKGFHEFSVSYATFQVSDNHLLLNFPPEYPAPFEETGLARQSDLTILKHTGKELELRYNPSPDESLIYYLEKW